MHPTDEVQECLRKWKENAIENYRKRNLYKNAEYEAGKIRQILGELCQKGANLNYLESERGIACMTHAFWSQNLIQFFIDKELSVNSADENGDTVLHLAIRHAMYDPYYAKRYGYDDPINLITFLVCQCSADLNIRNLCGETPLFTLARSAENTREIHKIWTLAKMFMDRGADVTTRNVDGQSVLHMCTYYRFITELEEDIDARTSSYLYSQTPLMLAARNGNLGSCRQLITKGAFINAQDIQGYTALHHAVLNDNECAEFLINMGADQNLKSASGRDAYQLSIHPNKKILGAVSPIKQAEHLEITGAMIIMKYHESEYYWIQAKKHWEEAMDICKKFNLKCSQELLANYKVIRLYLQAIESASWVYIQSHQRQLEGTILSAVNTVARLSEGSSDKFWNLLSNADVDSSERPSYIFGVLDNIFLSNESRSFEDFASFEEKDFNSLLRVVSFFDMRWLRKLVESGSKNKATPERISQLHSISQLVISCFNKLMQETNSKKVSKDCIEIYVKLIHTLTLLHSGFKDIINSGTTLNDNKLTELDLRDMDGNSLLHLIFRNNLTCNWSSRYEFEPELTSLLLDFKFVDVKARNRMGFEPVQMFDWNKVTPISKQFLEMLVKMADMGSHVDVRNCVWGESTLREIFVKANRSDLLFRYDSLQCTCARVLARSLILYKNRVPKLMVDFIRNHMK